MQTNYTLDPILMQTNHTLESSAVVFTISNQTGTKFRCMNVSSHPNQFSPRRVFSEPNIHRSPFSLVEDIFHLGRKLVISIGGKWTKNQDNIFLVFTKMELPVNDCFNVPFHLAKMLRLFHLLLAPPVIRAEWIRSYKHHPLTLSYACNNKFHSIRNAPKSDFDN